MIVYDCMYDCMYVYMYVHIHMVCSLYDKVVMISSNDKVVMMK